MPVYAAYWSTIYVGARVGPNDGMIFLFVPICAILPMHIGLLIAAGIAKLRWFRLPPPGYCSACRYNLAGSVSGVCPECGSEIAS